MVFFHFRVPYWILLGRDHILTGVGQERAQGAERSFRPQLRTANFHRAQAMGVETDYNLFHRLPDVSI